MNLLFNRCCAFFLLLAALCANIQHAAVAPYHPQRCLIIVLDISASMSCTTNGVERRSAAQHFLQRVARLLPQSEDTLYALITFDGNAAVAIPPTTDTYTYQEILNDFLTIPPQYNGSNLAEAIRLAETLASSENTFATTILLVTDGEADDSEIALPPIDDCPLEPAPLLWTILGTESPVPPLDAPAGQSVPTDKHILKIANQWKIPNKKLSPDMPDSELLAHLEESFVPDNAFSGTSTAETIACTCAYLAALAILVTMGRCFLGRK